MFKRNVPKAVTPRDLEDLMEAREAARKARQQLVQARARRPRIEEEMRRQHVIREEDGFAEIIEQIFITREEE